MQCAQCGHTINRKNSPLNCFYCGASTGGDKQTSGPRAVDRGKRSPRAKAALSTGASPGEGDAVRLAELPEDLRQRVVSALSAGKSRRGNGIQRALFNTVPTGGNRPAPVSFSAGAAGRLSEKDVDLYFEQLRGMRKTTSKRRYFVFFFLLAAGLSIGMMFFFTP